MEERSRCLLAMSAAGVTINQVLQDLVLLTPAHGYAVLVLNTFWNVQPVAVQVGMQQT